MQIQTSHDWFLSQIHLGNVLQHPQLTESSHPPVIAVIDSGVDVHHPKLRANIVNPWNAFDGSRDVRDLVGHGTQVAEMILRVYPQAKIMPVKVANDEVVRSQIAQKKRVQPVDLFAAANAIQMLASASTGVRVINLSFGFTDDISRGILEYVIHKVMQTRPDLVFVASCGNEGTNVKHYPAAVTDAVISVGSTVSKSTREDMPNEKSQGSGHGQDWVHVAAPTVGLRTARARQSLQQEEQAEEIDKLGDTSLAAPQVAALAAMLLALRPQDSRQDVRHFIFDHCSRVLTDRFEYGIINIQATIEAATCN